MNVCIDESMDESLDDRMDYWVDERMGLIWRIVGLLAMLAREDCLGKE